MVSVLEDAAIRRAAFPLSVEFYHQASELGLLSEEVELLEGTLVQKMSKSPLHEGIVWEIYELLRGVVGEGLWVLKESPLTFRRSEPEPDLSVVLGQRHDYRGHHPTTAELVIEIAVSTVDIDRRKAGIYADAGVKEYWVVVPGEGWVEVFHQPQGDTYAVTEVVKAPALLTSMALPQFSLNLGDLFRA